MKAKKNNNVIILSLIFLCTMLFGSAHAQEQGLRWSKWSEGQGYDGSGSLVDKVIDSYVDNMGNTYIFGKFGMDARLGENGPYICPMDSAAVSAGYLIENSQGVYLAKIDSLGNIMWCKSTRGGSKNSLALEWNMAVKDSGITIAFDVEVGSEWWNWYYFFDTMLVEPVRPGQPRVSYMATYFVTFDFEGNMIDVHDVRLWALSRPDSPIFFAYGLGGLADGRFGIDNDGCIHIFSCTTGWRISEDSVQKAYIIVDGDTNRKYPLNIHTQNGQYCFPSVYYKMSSDWHLLDCHYMIDTVVGWQPDIGYYSLASLKITNVLVEEDGLYLNGYFDCKYEAIDIAETMSDTSTFSATIFLDSIHYLKAENTRDFGTLPFLMKLNKNGEIVWVQQIYTESPNDGMPNFVSLGKEGLAVDSNNVYCEWWPSYLHDYQTNPNYFYLDSAHTIPMVNHTIAHVLITSYDKQTGSPIEYYYVDTVNRTLSQTLAVQGDFLVFDVVSNRLKTSELCKINKYTKEVTKSMPITYSWTNVVPKSMSINSSGWVFRSSTGEGARVFDSISVSPIVKTSIMTLFYDSSLDMRIKPCPQVDSLWGSISQQTATLQWGSTFAHAGYELAYIPDGGSWDNAATLEVTGNAATIDLPDDLCYQFRIRGLCDGRREATSPWSDPVTLCPEVGIADIEPSNAITLSPNPTSGRVKVSASEPIRQVAVYDMAGKEVFEAQAAVPQSEWDLDLGSLPSGSYIVKVTTKSRTTTHKLIVE